MGEIMSAMRGVTPVSGGGGVIAGVSARLQIFVCGLSGHNVLLSFEPGRLSLRCTSCPYQTRGWTLKAPAVSTDPAAHQGRQRRPVLLEQNAQ
jgi:hypothetical protein